MNAASLTLSRDELLVVLAILRMPFINGLDQEAFATLSPVTLETRKKAGEASLVKRDLIAFLPARRLQLDDALVALVGAATAPEATLLLSRLDPDGRRFAHYFSFTPDIFIEHFVSQDDSFHFNHLPDEISVERRIRALLASLEPLENPYSDSMVIWKRHELRTFLEQCRSANHSVATALSPRDLSLEWSQSFQNDCATQPIWTAVSGWNLRNSDAVGNASLLIVHGTQACWLAQPAEENAVTICVTSVTGRECVAAILRLLQSLLVSAQSIE